MRRAGWPWLLLITLAVPAAAQLPGDLAGYDRWKVLRGSGLLTDGAHPGMKTVYVNAVGAASKPPPFPPGTVIVKSGVKAGFVHLVVFSLKR